MDGSGIRLGDRFKYCAGSGVIGTGVVLHDGQALLIYTSVDGHMYYMDRGTIPSDVALLSEEEIEQLPHTTRVVLRAVQVVRA